MQINRMKNIAGIVLILLLGVSSYGQALEKQQKYADSLFAAGDFFNSITEFKRLLFFDENNSYKYSANFNIGLAYKSGAKLAEASKYFALAALASRTPDENYESTLQIVRVEILRRNSKLALRLLSEFETDEKYISKKSDLIYWRGWAYIFSDEWEKAAEEFSKISPDHELVTLCKSVSSKKLSVTFAKVISYILPGSGQFYSGEYLSGFMSLAWNVFLGYHTINAAASERVFDALAVGNLAWLRFYRGNIQNAEKFAVEKNIEIANEALYYLQTNYEGIKP